VARRCYYPIEDEPERVYKLVAEATTAHLYKIEQSSARIVRFDEDLLNNARQVHQLKCTVKI
jgi:hypothetical protein